MAVAIQQESDDTYVIRINGLLKKLELESVQLTALDGIEKAGTIKLLVILDDFQGWQKGDDWGDMSFYSEHGDQIDKIAIVGDPKWEDEMLMFAGSGLRRAPVKYFSESDLAAAQAWL